MNHVVRNVEVAEGTGQLHRALIYAHGTEHDAVDSVRAELLKK